jgi:preprotein translocase subunit SecY
MIGNVQNILKIPELKHRILFTLGILAVYRVGVHIPTPGVDGGALSAFFQQQQNTLLSFFDLFSGGALSQLTIFALGIMPYISASIILDLMTVVVPHLDRLKKEGDAGRKKINQYARYGTILLAAIQALGISIGLESMTSPSGDLVVLNPGWAFRSMTVLTLTAGTSFIMWLGEQITERGIGNGISLIIFAGIVARLPAAIISTLEQVRIGELQVFLLITLVIFMLAVVGGIVFMEAGQRRIPVQYAKRVVGRKMYGGQSTHLPLKINTSGVIPAIFASSIIVFPATITQFIQHPWMQDFSNSLRPGTLIYTILITLFIFFFVYFYTAIIFNPTDVADNMKKYGGFVPGIRPGKRTSDHIDRILTRLTFVAGIYLSAVVVLPSYMIRYLNVPFFFGGTALLIVVGVAMDTMQQIESHLVMRHYEGFIKKGKLKGRTT